MTFGCCPRNRRIRSGPTGNVVVLRIPRLGTIKMLRSHKRALDEIKSGRQRVAKATEERDKLKAKLKKAQARLVAEQGRLKASEEKLES